MVRHTKGTRSKTHRGRKNYTTKKGSKVFNPAGHYLRKSYRPYSRSRRRMGGKSRSFTRRK